MAGQKAVQRDGFASTPTHGTETVDPEGTTIRIGLAGVPPRAVGGVVRAAIRCGCGGADTASIYRNERALGEALRQTGRTEFPVTTKLWNTDQGYDSARHAFDRSRERLGLDRIGLYLIHWPAPARGLYVKTWRALVRIKAEGYVDAIGVSNFLPQHLDAIVQATGVPPSVNQIELHPRFQQRGLRDIHRQWGIATQAWSPLALGAALDEPVVREIARRRGKTPAQIVLRWHLDIGVTPLPRSVQPERVFENAVAADFRLDDEELVAIASLDDPAGRIGEDPLDVT